MQVHEVIENVKNLPEDELRIFSKCFEEFEQEIWCDEFEKDVKNGKLEKLAEQAIKDFRAGRCQKL
jgi:hypothetical protein